MSTSVKTKSSLPSSSSEVYETLAIDPAFRDRLESSASFIYELGRRTTEQTFELGDHLEQAATLLADGTFDKWVKTRCGLAARSARNYMAVFRNLSPYRNELVDLSVGSTVLFHLSSATPEQIEEALTFAEDNGRLQVADVKTILSGGDQDDSTPENSDLFLDGGVVGLKALIALKTRDGLKAFIAHLGSISQIIQVELAKKRVIKEALAKQVNSLSRISLLELESLALFVDPKIDLSHSARAMTFPATTPWARVNATLQCLSNVEAWPKSGEMRAWLEGEVLPILDWTMSKERKPEWPLAGAVIEGPTSSGDGKAVDVTDADIASLSIGDQVAEAGETSDAVPVSPERASEPDEVPVPMQAQMPVLAPIDPTTTLRANSKARSQVADVPALAHDLIDEAEDEVEEDAPALAVMA